MSQMRAVRSGNKTPLELKVLPNVNLMRFENEVFLEDLLTEILECDRERFRQYFTERPLGLGLITAVSFLNPTFVF
jgi:hypothetical protein